MKRKINWKNSLLYFLLGAIILFVVFTIRFSDNKRYIPVHKYEGKEYILPSEVALYAIEYSNGKGAIIDNLKKNKRAAKKCVSWLMENVKNKNGYNVWENEIYDPYTNISSKDINCDKWISGFTQAIVAEAFLTYYDLTKKEEYFDIALKALAINNIPKENGGFLGALPDGGIWYETVIRDIEQYDLIGELETVYVLSKISKYPQCKDDLKVVSGKAAIDLDKWIRYFDGCYYILDNQKLNSDLTFRFYNEYENEDGSRHINRAILKDPVDDYVYDADYDKTTSSYQIKIPKQNYYSFRKKWFELTLQYSSSEKDNLTTQVQSSLKPGQWVSVIDGNFLIDNKTKEQSWIVPIRPVYLGNPSTQLLQLEYKILLDKICSNNDVFYDFNGRATGYYNINYTKTNFNESKPKKIKLPKQTPPTPVFSFDKNGVVMQHLSHGSSFKDEMLKRKDFIAGPPVYNLVAVYLQATGGWFPAVNKEYYSNKKYWNSYDFLTEDNIPDIRKEPALKWIYDNAKGNNFAIWQYPFDNCYNDLVQDAGWVSAYGQSLMIDVLMQNKDKNLDLIRKAAYAYMVKTEDGGLACYDKKGGIWFEEVPNQSHILNADLLSINTLNNINDFLDDEKINAVIKNAIDSLKEKLWRYDAGYWTNYDLNPQKDILFQLDWESNNESPKIDLISVADPVSETQIILDVGSEEDFKKFPYISGRDWGVSQNVDNKSIRQIKDTHDQCTYFRFVLPKLKCRDYFDIVGYILTIRYKDISEGVLYIKRQAINEGNVLMFSKLPNAKIQCIGDNKWKEFQIIIRPQALAWYMGKEYQLYHIDVIKKLYQTTNDWYFNQCARKWTIYLNDKE